MNHYCHKLIMPVIVDSKYMQIVMKSDLNMFRLSSKKISKNIIRTYFKTNWGEEGKGKGRKREEGEPLGIHKYFDCSSSIIYECMWQLF